MCFIPLICFLDNLHWLAIRESVISHSASSATAVCVATFSPVVSDFWTFFGLNFIYCYFKHFIFKIRYLNRENNYDMIWMCSWEVGNQSHKTPVEVACITRHQAQAKQFGDIHTIMNKLSCHIICHIILFLCIH